MTQADFCDSLKTVDARVNVREDSWLDIIDYFETLTYEEINMIRSFAMAMIREIQLIEAYRKRHNPRWVKGDWIVGDSD